MYCLPGDVRDVLYPGTATTVSSGAANLDSEFLLQFIAEAENEVNARLAVRYTVPFPDDTVPQVVATITRDLAAFYADASNRGQLAYSGQFDPILMRRDRASTLLDQLAKGQAELGQVIVTTDGTDGSHGTDAGRAGVVINTVRGGLTRPGMRGGGGDSLNMGGVDWEYHPWGPYGPYGGWW